MAINFKGTSEGGICVNLPEDMDFIKILREFYQCMDSNRSFFKKGNVVIHFRGRVLSSSDKLRLEAPVKQFCETWQIYYGDMTYSDSSGIRKTLTYKIPEPKIDETALNPQPEKPPTLIIKQQSYDADSSDKKPENPAEREVLEREAKKREEIQSMLHRWDEERMRNSPEQRVKEITEKWDREMERAERSRETAKLRLEKEVAESVSEAHDEKKAEKEPSRLLAGFIRKCEKFFGHKYDT